MPCMANQAIGTEWRRVWSLNSNYSRECVSLIKVLYLHQGSNLTVATPF